MNRCSFFVVCLASKLLAVAAGAMNAVDLCSMCYCCDVVRGSHLNADAEEHLAGHVHDAVVELKRVE